MANLQCPSVDINPLSPNGFILVINKLPGVSFFAQECNIPGLTLGEPEFSNPFRKQPIPGDEITYEMFEITFQVDQMMNNYIAVHDWMVALGFPNDYEQYKELVGNRAVGMTELASNYSDGSLFVLDVNNKPIREIRFSDLFPIDLSGITLTSKSTGVNYVAGVASFKYGYYKII